MLKTLGRTHVLDGVVFDPICKPVRPILLERSHEPVRAVLVDLGALCVIQPSQTLHQSDGDLGSFNHISSTRPGC